MTLERRRWMALVVVCLAQLMIVLDTTIVNVALPSIQRDLHFTQGNLTWVVNAFLVTFGSFLLLAVRLGRQLELPHRSTIPPGHRCGAPGLGDPRDHRDRVSGAS